MQNILNTFSFASTGAYCALGAAVLIFLVSAAAWTRRRSYASAGCTVAAAIAIFLLLSGAIIAAYAGALLTLVLAIAFVLKAAGQDAAARDQEFVAANPAVTAGTTLDAGFHTAPSTRPDTRSSAKPGTRSTTGSATLPAAAGDGYAQIEKRLSALADALERQRQMHSLMSHEMRAPVSTISMATQSLEMVLAGSGEEVDRRLDRISRAVARITELMDQLLSQSTLEDDAMAPQRTRVDLGELAREVAAGLRTEAAHTLQVVAPAPVEAWCDGPLSGVVLRNLIHNAIKYSPADQPIQIDVRAATDGELATITVTDHGPGIEKDVQEKIFDPHFRRAAHRETKGLGLGLHLVRKICERQGGRLTVASEPGHGARFTMALPTRQES
ncbi:MULTISPECIES: sensor histidine kinase KdpD [unclassified Achromobacter]|uniref:sensor histidine kinase n=1 Tax=unclassified Achromobacter TaxID=2626865 RepID=UPI001303618C|nr:MULTISPECIES: HAMP domain-containing sensor histidine kinase [unclassified Achromobacter]